LRAVPVPRANAEMDSLGVEAVAAATAIKLRLPAHGARAFPGTTRAFTLIELVVVITIIVVLLGLLFPAFQGVQNQAKKTQAKNDLTQIVTAVNAFYTEYGRYPLTPAAPGDTKYGSGTSNGPLFNELRNVSATENPRGIAFISPPDAKDQTSPRAGIKPSDGQFYDPWGTPYNVALDTDYDNTLAASTPNYSDLTNPIRQGVIAWSVGKDGKPGKNGNNKFSGSDDVISWQ
jgi:prepilin-type N-terminal cleavage/methylation domain-containing protein